MGDGSGAPYISPGDDESGCSSDNEEQHVEPHQTGVDEYTDSDSDSQSPEDDDSPDTPDTSTATAPPSETENTGGGGGGGVIGIPEDVDIVEDSPDNSDEESESPENEQTDGPESPEEEVDEESDENEDEDEDEDEDQVPKVVQYSDAWDNIGWGLYPIMLKIEERYGEEVETDYQLVPVRDFEFPEEMTSKWETDSYRHKMPIDTSVWKKNPPESTELANRAYLSAMKQGKSIANQYLRRLRTAAIVEGLNIENKDTLFELARNVGLDTDQLEASWNEINVRTSTRDPNPPITKIHVDGEEVTQHGYLHYDDIVDIFDQAGIESNEPRPLPKFVTEYGPVTTKEVMSVYEWDREHAVEELQQRGEIIPVKIGVGRFWVRQ
ncbi:hypothetical protein E4P24_02785 [Haloferax sp. AS1]|uniref:DsbA family protein n=1 Tax=Haloferax sp. AS1 TaxID=2562277 RepID=UPI00165FFDF7|nr:DsbA family protein [Haloferax sp. AS1]MBC9985297.1 hypothetical protein [Haloferax sp. AS1]